MGCELLYNSTLILGKLDSKQGDYPKDLVGKHWASTERKACSHVWRTENFGSW